MPRKTFVDLVGTPYAFEGRILEDGIMVYHSADPDEIRETLAAFAKAHKARAKLPIEKPKTK